MKNALICFLKFPEPGNVKTRLAADLSAQTAASLYEALAERVITEVYPLNGSYELLLYVDPGHDLASYRHWIGPDWSLFKQQGSDLGERLRHAFETTFEQGFERVAVIGTDCVGMDQAYIEDAFEKLASHDFIIGPSTDGGYFFLGMKQPSSWMFENVVWSTETVLETTLDKIEVRQKTVLQLDEKIDIDTLEDLVKFKDNLPEEHFLAKKVDQLILGHVTIPLSPDEVMDD